MQSVCVYYVDLLNDMKTTVKTFLISMLLKGDKTKCDKLSYSA